MQTRNLNSGCWRLLPDKHFNLWTISKGESFSSCTRHEVTGDISQRQCMPQNKSCHVVKQGDRVLGKYFNDSSCLQNSLPKWLSPSLALWQCCQLAVAHGRWKKMTGSFNYLSCLQITLIKFTWRLMQGVETSYSIFGVSGSALKLWRVARLLNRTEFSWPQESPIWFWVSFPLGTQLSNLAGNW
jgi:hypothetical protein